MIELIYVINRSITLLNQGSKKQDGHTVVEPDCSTALKLYHAILNICLIELRWIVSDAILTKLFGTFLLSSIFFQ